MGGEGKKAVGEGQPNSRHGDNAEQEAWGPAAWLGGSMQAVTSNLARLPAHILLKPNTQRMRAISPFSRIVKPAQPVMGLTGGHRAAWRGHLSSLRSDLSLVSQDRLFFFFFAQSTTNTGTTLVLLVQPLAVLETFVHSSRPAPCQ